MTSPVERKAREAAHHEDNIYVLCTHYPKGADERIKQDCFQCGYLAGHAAASPLGDFVSKETHIEAVAAAQSTAFGPAAVGVSMAAEKIVIGIKACCTAKDCKICIGAVTNLLQMTKAAALEGTDLEWYRKETTVLRNIIQAQTGTGSMGEVLRQQLTIRGQEMARLSKTIHKQRLCITELKRQAWAIREEKRKGGPTDD